MKLLSSSSNKSGSFFTTSLKYNKNTTPPPPKGLNNIAIINFDGVIMSGSPVFDEWRKSVLAVYKHPENYLGVILRINSPGGAVAPTQEILEQLESIKEKKVPIYCSIADVAASGGYYLASVCDEIFANRGSTTGSIGVIMQSMNLKELFKFAKITPVVLKAGKNKDMGSPHKENSPEQLALFQNMLDEIHGEFKKDIAKHRGDRLSQAVLEEYADGRILSGLQAHKLGFVDQLGGLEKCKIAMLKKIDKTENDIKWVILPKKQTQWRTFFKESTMASLFLKKEIPGLQSLLMKPATPYFLPEGWTF